ncbi:hypothetical protein BH18ACI2_BH18ACI2_12330 [soil metagenome]
MSSNRLVFDYDPVIPSRSSQELASDAEPSLRNSEASGSTRDTPAQAAAGQPLPNTVPHETWQTAVLKRGHSLSYAGLFLFTLFVYFRPYELIPALSPLTSAAYYIAILTILVFFPSQLGLEGTLTLRPREVNLVLLLCLGALLSIPLAINPGEAWEMFNEYLKVVLMFIVLVNVVRTERRLKILLLLLLVGSCILSMNAVSDYRAGRLTMGGERISGIIGGMFGNPNDLAMHLATMVPIAVALFLVSRGPHRKLFYGAAALVMAIGTVVTFSRGGFLGLAAAGLALSWKLGRRNRPLVMVATVVALVAFFAFAPGEYAGRLKSIVDDSDSLGSAGARQDLLERSVIVTIANPVFGIGMGNFHIVSIHEQVSHNAYTQIGAELGMASMIIYILFILAPLKRLRRIERETLNVREMARAYYLAVGLQASLLAYMIASFFGSVAYLWYIYYLVGFAFCFSRLYEAKAIKQTRRPETSPVSFATS